MSGVGPSLRPSTKMVAHAPSMSTVSQPCSFVLSGAAMPACRAAGRGEGRSAAAVVALGVVALGVVALGVVALGVVALGVVALGVVALGAVAFEAAAFG